MTDLLHEPEVQEEVEPSFDEQTVEAFDALRAEETDEPEAVASTDGSEVEAPDTHEPQEPTSEPLDEDLEYARRVVNIFKENPELRDTMVALERGEAAVIPREVLEAAQRYQAPQETTDPDEDLYSDPFAVIKSLKEDIEQFKAYQQQSSEARRQQEWAQNTNIVETVEQEFFRNHPELSEHRLRLFEVIGETNLIRRYRKKFNGDNRRAVAEALEAAHRMEFPEAAAAAAQRKIARDAQAKRRAGAAAASPRSMPRNKPEERPTSKADRLERFAEIIREDLEAQV